MKILFAELLNYLFTSGGAHKANRALMEKLVEQGHRCWVVASSLEPGPRGRAQLLNELARRNIPVVSATSDVVVFYYNGVKVHTVTGDLQTYSRLLPKLMREFKPAWTLVSEDRTFLLLEAALAADPDHVVYVAHSQATLPFGPASFSADPAKRELFRRTAGIITVSHYVKEYIQTWAGLDSVVLPFPAYGSGPFPSLGRFDTGSVTLVNPSAIKGVSIFLALARQMPEVQFAAIPTWATTEADLTALKQLPNVHLQEPSDNVDEFLAQTRILLVPSLWGESFGQLVIDAMLRGIPVLTSNVGGLPEAKLGVEYVLPVRPIEQYEEQLDAVLLPLPIVPDQEIGPWRETLQRLLSNRAEYERLSLASREAALKFVAGTRVERFVEFLERLTPTPRLVTESQDSPPLGETSDELGSLMKEIGGLTSETQRAMLALLRKKVQGPRTAPLSLNQEQLWFLDQLKPGDPLYNMPSVTRLTGRLDQAILERSLNQLLERHAALRTSFALEAARSEPVQVIAPALSVSLSSEDLRGLPDAERETEARRLSHQIVSRPLDLSQSPLLRATLLRLGDEEHILILIVHHIISDGWSMNILLRDLVALYQAVALGKPAALPELPLQYEDFCRRQREQVQSDRFDAHLAYWEQHLAGAPTLDLPTDRPRPPLQTYQGTHQRFIFSQSLGQALIALSRRQGATLFVTLLAAFKTLLYRYTGQADLCVGTVVANRKQAELEPLVGFLANTVVLRTQLDGQQTFLEYLGRVRETIFDAQEYSDVPFGKLVERLQPERDPSRSPLFQVLFSEALSMSTFTSNQMTLRPVEVDTGTARFDLILTTRWDPAQGLLGTLGYNTDLFDDLTITRLIEHLRVLLENIVAQPDERLATISLLTEAERRQLLVEWNRTHTDFPREQCIPELLDAQVERTPEAIAVVLDDQHLTYQELNRRANQLAYHLRTLGVGPEILVGVCVERSVEMLVGMLGVLKAGGGYVPLDPSYPYERLAFMLADARIEVLITQSWLLVASIWSLVTSATSRQPTTIYLDTEWDTITNYQPPATNNPGPLASRIPRPAFSGIAGQAGAGQQPPSASPSQIPEAKRRGQPLTPENIAYVIYTSGSTGVPKGVVLAHQGLCNLTQAQRRSFDVRSDSRVLQFASFGFDASVSEVFVTLLAGATLCLGASEMLAPGPDLMRLLRDQAITTVTLPPSVLAVLPDEPMPALRTLVTAGEACSAALVARWSKGRRFINAYGPTEGTVCATQAECVDDTQPPSIGHPIDNVQIYILDSHLQPVPVGVTGEIYMSSVGLARNYLNRPELTAERFIPNPFAGMQEQAQGARPKAQGVESLSLEPYALRLYKTGDLARYLPNGNIEFLGRIDHQVKVRGYRIELGEIEAALKRYPGIQTAIVLARSLEPETHQDSVVPGEKQLVAYLVPAQPEPYPSVSDLRRFLQTQLPDYMLPVAYLFLEALPLTPNGKVDREALPLPEGARPKLEAAFTAPRTPVEETLAEIWRQTLRVEQIGVYDNFFELGGHSLLATQIVTKVHDAFQVELPLATLFNALTIADLAREVAQAQIQATGAQDLNEVLQQLEGLSDAEVAVLLDA